MLSVALRTRLAFVVIALVLVAAAGSAAAERRFATPPREPDPIAGIESRPALGYERGRKVAIRVVTIGWAEVEIRTARAFLAMAQAAQADGIELWIRSGYRPPEHQQWLYEAWRRGWGNPAARPGFSSHQSGRALDLDILAPGTFAWLDAHAKKFGFARTVRGEPWHWELVKRRASSRRASRRPAA
jgi:D-alanyl-D-alanine carboxypeptidase-like protein